jgi:hypothetical protein
MASEGESPHSRRCNTSSNRGEGILIISSETVTNTQLREHSKPPAIEMRKEAGAAFAVIKNCMLD